MAAQEGISATEDALNVVAQKADGGMRDALSIFDQLVAFCGDTLTYERAIEVLNVLDTEYYFRLTDMCLKSDVKGALLLLNEVLNKGFDAANFVSGFAKHLRDVLVAHDTATINLIETSDAIRQHYKQQAAYTPAVWIFKALDIIVDSETAYRTSKNKRLTVELMLIRLANLAAPAQPAAKEALPAPQVTAQAAKQAPAPQPAPQPQSAQTLNPSNTQTFKPSNAQPAQAAPQMPNIPNLPNIPSIGALSGEAGQSSVSASGVPTNNMQWGASSGLSGEAGQNTQRNTPFTADQLNGAWVGLKSTFKKEQRLVAMLDAHRPRLIDDHTALITFVNPWQEEEFKKFSRQILTILRDNLQNDTLLLQTVVAENMAPKRAYTAEEKYRVLQEQNPYLADFKKQFDMLLE